MENANVRKKTEEGQWPSDGGARGVPHPRGIVAPVKCVVSGDRTIEGKSWFQTKKKRKKNEKQRHRTSALPLSGVTTKR